MKTKYLLSIISGSLFSLSFAPFNVWPLLIFSLVLYIYLLNGLTYKQSFRVGYLYGLGIWSVGISWVYVSIHYHGNINIYYSIIITLLFIVLLSFYSALQEIIYKYFNFNRLSGPLLSFSLSWVLLELIRESLFTGFPWLIAGTSIAGSLIDGWIPIIGAIGMSILISVLSGSIYILITQLNNRKLVTFAVITILVIVTPGYLLKDINWTQKKDQITISVIQPNLTLKEKWSLSGIQKTRRIFEKAIKQADNKELIIFPETALILNESKQINWLNSMDKSARLKEVGIITGIIERKETDLNSEDSLIYNRIKGFGDAQGSYNKIKLVPFGEFIPFNRFSGNLLDLIGLKLTNTIPGQDYSSIIFKDNNISPSICYEVAFSNLIRKSSLNSNLLVTISNDTWFGGSIGPDQHLEIAQNRAIEHQKPLIRSTNSGISSIIDKNGNFLLKQGNFEDKSMKATISSYQGLTPFVKYGYLFTYIYLILGYLWLFFKKVTKVS